jgi:superfamily II DNA helicase RecQ
MVVQQTAFYVNIFINLSENIFLTTRFLVYHIGDALALMDQIKRDQRTDVPVTEEDTTRMTEEVRKVMEYCSNVLRCRRVQVLRYLGEHFDQKDCHNSCDVCRDNGEVTTRDVTLEAIEAINLVKSMSGNNTVNHCKAVFCGSRKKEIISRSHDNLPGHGKGSILGLRTVDQLFEELLTNNVLREVAVTNSTGWSNNYLQVSEMPAWHPHHHAYMI